MSDMVYTVREVAEKMGFSPQFIIKLFEAEPGVIIVERNRPGKRSYRSIRIPVRVYERVIRRLSS